MAATAAAQSSSSELTTDGPVLSVINKRLRALRKKLNRISQMEESLSLGKALNKEQEETLRSKPSVIAGIDELEKLRQPLSEALNQEIQFALGRKTEEPESLGAETPNEEETSKPEAKGRNEDASIVSDLLNLVYFGSIFDVKTLVSAHDNMLTRTHERNCCLTYDYVTDDDSAGDPLHEGDLDLISMLGGLLISRPSDSSLSHKNALQQCVEHAKLWLANSEQPIEPSSNITYASLREKLNKIMASEYMTTIPEIKAPVEVAAAAGNYTNFQVPIHGAVIPPPSVSISVEESASAYQQEEEESPNSHENGVYENEASPVEEHHKGGSEVETTSEAQAQIETGNLDAEVEQNPGDVDLKEQHYANRRPYQNYRSGRGGSGGGRRGYPNGRGGRGGNRGGGYQNGRSQYYDQPGGYHARNYNYRGRGGRGMGGTYNNYYHASAGHAGHAEAS